MQSRADMHIGGGGHCMCICSVPSRSARAPLATRSASLARPDRAIAFVCWRADTRASASATSGSRRSSRPGVARMIAFAAADRRTRRGARYATVQIARNRWGFNRSVARSTTSRGGKHVRKKFGRAKTGPAAASAARPRRSPSPPQCGIASSFMLGLASTRAFAPERSGGASASTKDARSSLTRSLRVWRRQPERPHALDGVCPAVGGDCRPRLCVPGSSSAGRATFSP